MDLSLYESLARTGWSHEESISVELCSSLRQPALAELYRRVNFAPNVPSMPAAIRRHPIADLPTI
jgi:hypothetical protein